MNLASMIESVKQISGRRTSNDQDDSIRDDINRVYRYFAGRHAFSGLLVEDDSFTTETSTFTYLLPYRMSRLIPNSVRYDVTDPQPGRRIQILKQRSEFEAYHSCQASGSPLAGFVTGGSGSAELSTTATATPNNSSAVALNTGSAAIGDYLVLGTDAGGKNGGDYGYKCVTASATPTITPLYKGPNLASGVTVTLNPGNTPRLVFAPDFTESGKVVEFSWIKKPERLYNDYDIPEVTELCDAIIYRVLADNPAYHRPQSFDRRDYANIAREYLTEAVKWTTVFE